MIKLFRKIRQRLLFENRLGNYLLYAVGEIVLVVVGILLALQINNWSEAQKQQKEEKKLLTALLEDFTENKTRIEATLHLETNMLQLSRSLIQAMQSEKSTIHPDTLRFWVASGAKSWWKTEFVTGTYEAMVSSGKVDILENDDLKQVLSQFSADITSGFEDHYESMQYLIEMNKLSAKIAPALIHDTQREVLGVLPDTDFDTAILQLADNEAYLGLLISKTWIETLRIKYQQKLLGYIDEILVLCEAEQQR
ncbi:MAG: DUF6090 family protein [Bacteroidota bacterium]